MAANLARAGFELAVCDAHRTRRPSASPPSTARRAAATPGRGRRRRRRRSSRWCPTRPQVEEVLFGDEGAAGALPEGALVIDMSTIAPTASRRDRPSGWRAASASWRRPCPGSQAQGRGRHAHDHGRRPSGPTSSARCRCFEAMGERIVHVGPAGPRRRWPSCSTNTMGAVNAAALARGRAHGQGGRARPRRLPGGGRRAAPAPAPCSTSRASPCSSERFEPPCSSSSTCSRTCATASPRRAALGHRAAARRARRAALRASRRGAATESRTSPPCHAAVETGALAQFDLKRNALRNNAPPVSRRGIQAPGARA